ncbi:MAG: hypothetical protein G3M70_06795 [Candidatus Nitronauta litoralis]|uniref:Secreted protein n=1 Tax=Candidatus Nitronauta litoralis TaxID=2705533 RepID=A0A7T0BV69_9BACT|nr:MAG: hypothetical protein G3M70_06795 [Candidatus Nitronauta litoralis]
MKIDSFKAALTAGFLVITLSIAMFQASLPHSAWAQDIDEVIQGLEQDFGLGNSKNDVKRSNLNAANEQNREDIKIKEQEGLSGGEGEEEEEAVLVDILLDIEETGYDSSITVEFVGGPTLATGIIGSMTQASLQLPAGSTQSLKITCDVADACSAWLFFIKGATFISSAEGPNGFFDSMSPGAMTITQIKVNADNSGPTNMNPGPPV